MTTPTEPLEEFEPLDFTDNQNQDDDEPEGVPA